MDERQAEVDELQLFDLHRTLYPFSSR
jgi:hypothetical protein